MQHFQGETALPLIILLTWGQKMQSHMKERKNCVYFFLNTFLLYYLETSDKKTDVWDEIFQTCSTGNLEHIDIFRVYGGSDALSLSSSPIQCQGHLGIAFIGFSFLHLALQHLQVGSRGEDLVT